MTSSEQRDKVIWLAFVAGVSLTPLVMEINITAVEIESIVRREFWKLKGK